MAQINHRRTPESGAGCTTQGEPTAARGLLYLLARSAELLEQNAEEIRVSHTVRGRWPRPDETGARRDFRELRDLAKQLRSAHKYHHRNCLGGPASMFDAMADRIRGGEPVASCMEDFGLAWRATSPTDAMAANITLAGMARGQEPLGAELEAVWDANTGALYEP